ncbi:FAD-dependent oxidoreductase [Streptomyces sp. NPDC055078]
MAATPPRTRSPHASGARTGTGVHADTDLIVIGGGPAGCAAARMAASVGMSTVLIERDVLCHSLYRIPALSNVLGGCTSGPELADAITAELRDTAVCRLELGRHATGLRAHDDHVTVTLDTGIRLTAPYAIVATGAGPLQPRDVPWLTAPSGLTLPPLWQAGADDAAGRTLLVLGGDRPIGTFLRAHPATGTRLLVAYPASDDYKIEEIRDDPRVTLHPVDQLYLTPRSPEGAAPTAETVGRDGVRRQVTADAVFLSIGNAPTAPPGDLVRDSAGYCLPADQHPRVLVAGDLRSARFQRIMTAMGSGGEAALRSYYATRGVADR